MKCNRSNSRIVWILATTLLILVLWWLDQNRGGPASLLSRCNLLLTRSSTPAVDVLVVGSSRIGTAIDPVAMENLLHQAYSDQAPGVERIAIGHTPLRLSHALLSNYLEKRGSPSVIALEVMFQTQRSIDRISERKPDIKTEHELFRRDLNMMTYSQILSMPALGMPFTEIESLLNNWSFKLRGVILRSGALIYQFIKHPFRSWSLNECDQAAWTKEPGWPEDFAFSLGEFISEQSASDQLNSLTNRMDEISILRHPKPRQSSVNEYAVYPYDFDAPYRQGEVELLGSIVKLADSYHIPIVLLPLPLYGYRVSATDIEYLNNLPADQLHVFDLYQNAPTSLDNFWYDDGHLDPELAGAMTTIVLSQYLQKSGFIGSNVEAP